MKHDYERVAMSKNSNGKNTYGNSIYTGSSAIFDNLIITIEDCVKTDVLAASKVKKCKYTVTLSSEFGTLKYSFHNTDYKNKFIRTLLDLEFNKGSKFKVKAIIDQTVHINISNKSYSTIEKIISFEEVK